MVNEDDLPPGSPEAIALGCTCPEQPDDSGNWLEAPECVIHAARYVSEDEAWPWSDDG